MPSTDIDGSVIVILSEKEAMYVYGRLVHSPWPLNKMELALANKIARDLELPKIEGRFR